MSELEETIYRHFQTHPQYTFSKEPTVKALEISAINHLKDKGYISIKANAIGFVIAEIS